MGSRCTAFAIGDPQEKRRELEAAPPPKFPFSPPEDVLPSALGIDQLETRREPQTTL